MVLIIILFSSNFFEAFVGCFESEKLHRLKRSKMVHVVKKLDDEETVNCCCPAESDRSFVLLGYLSLVSIYQTVSF